MEPSLNDDTVRSLDILVRTANRGERNAESIDIGIKEATPFTYISAKSFGATTDGLLENDEEYHYLFSYIFKNEKELTQFIDDSIVVITWKENDESKELQVNLPQRTVISERNS